MKITGERAVALIMESSSYAAPGVETYWFAVESRTAFCDEIVKARGAAPIIPLIVTGGFSDGNTVGEDLVRLLRDSQFAFLGIEANAESHVVLVLVSRAPLRIPQTSSPLELPSWFPGHGGVQLDVEIKDSRKSLLVSLKGAEAQVPRLHQLVHALEIQMLRILKGNVPALDRMLQLVHRPPIAGEKKADPRCTDPSGLGDFRATFLQSWEAVLAATTDPAGYRLEMSKEPTLAARLVGLLGATSAPDSQGKIASAVAESLRLDLKGPRPLHAVLWRPLSKETDATRIAGRQLLTTLYVTHQYTTAAAHADAYPSFPVALLGSTSDDLIAALIGFVDHLETITP